ncbi:MAG: multicopper oxidase domain-containing protein [Methylococcales bacterium]|nr:multicopper oxidase domain-containing protein [Methylococcales bacterium]
MAQTHLTRRTFLQAGISAAALIATPGLMAKMVPYRGDRTFQPDVELELRTVTDQVSILPGHKTQVQRYRARLLKGPASTLTELPDVYLGPSLNFQQGQKVRIILRNQLTEPHITHWHGLHVPQRSDGHPMYTLPAGGHYVYEFEVLNRAGTSFYHAHTHERTAEQVYHGLAGLITVTDADEHALALPSGPFEMPLVLQDRSFDANNQLRYLGHGMHDKMQGFLGDTVLVNGRPDAQFHMQSRAYRLRVLNGSNARIYKLALEDSTPLTAIGTDAGLLSQPEQRPYLVIAPGERIDLWLDLSGRELGDTLRLLSLPVPGVLPGMMGGGRGRMGGHGMDRHAGTEATITLAQFTVTERVTDSPSLPQHLVTIPKLTATDAAPIDLSLQMRPMSPSINGRSFSMTDIAQEEQVALGSMRRIRLINNASGMGPARMMAMAHPMHFHGQQFQVISRNTDAVRGDYASLKDGFLDGGWKDTVLVLPGETVEIIKPFEDFQGKFLFHCHNLEHEDLGMMRQFDVV